MKKFFKLFFTVFTVLAFAFVLASCGEEDPNQGGNNGGSTTNPTNVFQDLAAAEANLTDLRGGKKLYVTTFGQADFSYLQELVGEAVGTADFEVVEDKVLKAEDVEDGSLVIAIVGFTKKGISGDITQAGEVARAKAFAEKDGINLVVCQLDGKARRGESSDPIIKEAVKGAKLVMIYDDGKGADGADYDGFYTNECKNTKLYKFTDETDMISYFEVLIGA